MRHLSIVMKVFKLEWLDDDSARLGVMLPSAKVAKKLPSLQPHSLRLQCIQVSVSLVESSEVGCA